MQSLAERAVAPALEREIFAADEIGWVGAEAEVRAVLLGTQAGPLDDAHALIPALGRVAAHPRLVAAAGARLGGAPGIAASAYWRSWTGAHPVLPPGEGIVALVFLGWRGCVAGPNGRETGAELGAVLWCDAADAARLGAAGGRAVGPFFAVRYAAGGPPAAALDDACLWPSSWCV
jgi:hypothetical protein